LIDAADYAVWRNIGGPPDYFNNWRANFGQSFSFGGGSAAAGSAGGPAIPEPETIIRFSCAAAGFATGNVGRRRKFRALIDLCEVPRIHRKVTRRWLISDNLIH
jgi:hypothetical protein